MSTKKIVQQHIYGTHEARIFALDDGTLRVSLFDGERRLKSWPIERTDEAVRKIAKHLGNIRAALVAKHGPDTGQAHDAVEAAESHDAEALSVSDAKVSIGKEFNGEEPQIFPADIYIKPDAMKGIDAGALYWNRKGWAVVTDARSESEAQRIGQKIQKNLIAPTKLGASYPYVHTLPLFVIYKGGRWVRLSPVEKKDEAKTGPSISEQKDAIVRMGEEVFGRKSIRIAGSSGRYVLSINPTAAKMRKTVKPGSTSAPTLDGLRVKLEGAISAAERVR